MQCSAQACLVMCGLRCFLQLAFICNNEPVMAICCMLALRCQATSGAQGTAQQQQEST